MEYIPGYTTLKNLAANILPQTSGSLFPAVHAKYELFANPSNTSPGSYLSQASSYLLGSPSPGTSGSPSASGTPTSSNTIGRPDYITQAIGYASPQRSDGNIPIWSSNIQYVTGDSVKFNGLLFTSVKNSLNANPIKEYIDNYNIVNNDFWKCNGLSAEVIRFNEETDTGKMYLFENIVERKNKLYLCTKGGAGCTTDFTDKQWSNIGSSYYKDPTSIPDASISQQVKGSVSEDALLSSYISISTFFRSFLIQDIPGETFSGKIQRIVYLVLPIIIQCILFFLAIIFASFSANDLLHKEAPYRILAFIYTFYFVIQETYLGGFIFLYYLVRAFFSEALSMDGLEIYGILPIWEDPNYKSGMFPPFFTYPMFLRSSIQKDKERFNAFRLASHGDISALLRRALRIPIKRQGMVQNFVGNATNVSLPPPPQPQAQPQPPPQAQAQAQPQPQAQPQAPPQAPPPPQPQAQPQPQSETPASNSNSKAS